MKIDYQKLIEKDILLKDPSSEIIKEEIIDGIGSIKLIGIGKLKGYNIIEFKANDNYEISNNYINYLNTYYDKYTRYWNNHHKTFTKDMLDVILEGYVNKNTIHWEVLSKDRDRKYDVINNFILRDYENQMKKLY